MWPGALFDKAMTIIRGVVDFFGLDKQLLGRALVSLVGTFGVMLTLQTSTNERIITSSIIGVVFFALLFWVECKLPVLQRRERILQHGLAVFLAIITIIGTQLDALDGIIWSFSTLIKIVCLYCALQIVCRFVIASIKSCKLQNWPIKNYRKLFWITFAVIALADVLVYLALFPGVYHYDAGFQIIPFLSDEGAAFTTHYSLLYSALLAGCIRLGDVLFGSIEIGFGIYTFLQMIFLSFVATKVTIFVTKKTRNSYLYLFCVTFFGFFPFFTVAIVSSMQDVFFSGIFALIFINLVELTEEKDYWCHIYKPITLAVLTLLLCLFRNNGIYCVICIIPFILVFCKNKRILTTMCLVTPLVIYKIIVGPIYQAVGVIEYDTYREMSSVPSQQLARVYNYNHAAFSDEDIKQLFTYYSADIGLDNYMPLISDPTKAALDNEVVKQDLMGYIKLWVKIGTKDFENYLEGFLMNTLGFWFPGKNYPDPWRMYHVLLNYDMLDTESIEYDLLTINRTSLLPPYEKLLRRFVRDNVWQKIPIVASLVSGGSYFILFVCATGVIAMRKKWKLLVPLSLVAGLYVTLFLSPVALFRYYFPIVVIMPILISMILTELATKHRTKV